MSENWIKHMESLYDKDVINFSDNDWKNWVKVCNDILVKDEKGKLEARNTCGAAKNLANLYHLSEIKDRQQKAHSLLNALKGFGFGGGSKKSRKSKQSLKSRKVKSKVSKSRKTQKSRQSKKQSKKIKLEVELSKEMSKRMSKKTPMIASSHGISLLKRSKRNMSKGRPLASARDFLLATSILTAALSPYDSHPMAKKSQIAPDTQVHLDWHKGQFPDKQLTSKQYKNLMKRSKRGKRLSTIKEGGGWSLKYKRSIDCKRPKGFSQKQYCKRILKKKKKKRTKKNRKKRTKKSRKMRGGQRVLNWISVPNGLRELVEEEPDTIYKLVWRDRDDKDFGYDIRTNQRETEDVRLTVTRDKKGQTVFTTSSTDPKSLDWMRLYVPTHRGKPLPGPPAYLEAGKNGDQYLIIPKDRTSELYQESKQKRKMAKENVWDDDYKDDGKMVQIAAQRAPQGLRYKHNSHLM